MAAAMENSRRMKDRRDYSDEAFPRKCVRDTLLNCSSTGAIFSNLRQTGGPVRQTLMVKWRLRNTLQSSFHIGSGNGGRALEKDESDEIKRFGAKHRIGGGDDWRSAIGWLVRFGGAGGRRGFRAAVPRFRRPRTARGHG